MSQVNQLTQPRTDKVQETDKKLQELELIKISSSTLARLIEEVRNEETSSVHMYNRMHNRHNRSR